MAPVAADSHYISKNSRQQTVNVSIFRVYSQNFDPVRRGARKVPVQEPDCADPHGDQEKGLDEFEQSDEDEN